MKLLVTGGAGYIFLLEKGYEVSFVDRFFFGTDRMRDVSDKVHPIKDDIR
ncbi:MAG: hypothetical protein ACUVTL_06850 [Thermoproteota archaeon]